MASSPQVGLAMVHLHALIHALSAEHSAAGRAEERLALPDVQAFCKSEFGSVPLELDAEFAGVAMRAPGSGNCRRHWSNGGGSPHNGEPVVDFARFVRLLYFLTMPDGKRFLHAS